MINIQKIFIVPMSIAVIATLVIFTGIGYYTKKTKVVEVKDEVRVVDNQVDGWNTYKNFGIEFQYPKNSITTRLTEIITPDNIYIVVPGVTVNIYSGTDIGSGTNVDGYTPTSRKISVGGKTATEITELINGISVVRYDFSINFTQDNKTVSFGGVEIDPSSASTTTQQQKYGLYKIASTFGTYNNLQAPIGVDTGWSIYKNYGIEFEYPRVSSFSGTDIYGISQIKINVAEQNDSNNGIGSNGCEVMPNNPSLQTSQVTINSMKFCLGSAMTANDATGYPYFYDYTFLKDGKYYTISYSLSSPDPMNKSSVIKQVEKSISTLKLNAISNVSKSTNFSPTMIGWKTFSDPSQGISFEYPSLISVKKEVEKITLNHYIAHKHNSSCDFKGDAPPLENLTDFDVSLVVSNENVENAKKSNFAWSYDKFNAGSLSGLKGESGIEGCGQYIYLFPVSETKTLIIKRSYITEFKPIIADYQKYLNLPGIIPPTQEDDIFAKIISTLKFEK